MTHYLDTAERLRAVRRAQKHFLTLWALDRTLRAADAPAADAGTRRGEPAPPGACRELPDTPDAPDPLA